MSVRASLTEFEVFQDEQEQASPEPETPEPVDGPETPAPGGLLGSELIEQPTTVATPPPALLSSLLSQLESISPERAEGLGGGTGANVVSGAQSTVLGATDIGDLLT